jgi:hypothetical protein
MDNGQTTAAPAARPAASTAPAVAPAAAPLPAGDSSLKTGEGVERKEGDAYRDAFYGDLTFKGGLWIADNGSGYLDPATGKWTPGKVKDATAQQPDPLHAIVDRWFADAFHGSPLGNQTELWNLVHGAKEDLKRRLSKAAA